MAEVLDSVDDEAADGADGADGAADAATGVPTAQMVWGACHSPRLPMDHHDLRQRWEYCARHSASVQIALGIVAAGGVVLDGTAAAGTAAVGDGTEGAVVGDSVADTVVASAEELAVGVGVTEGTAYEEAADFHVGAVAAAVDVVLALECSPCSLG